LISVKKEGKKTQRKEYARSDLNLDPAA